MKRVLIVLGLSTLLFAQTVAAQVERAEIGGTLTDESGAVLPGVNMTALLVATGAKRIVVSDSAGRYQFNQMPIGVYRFEATLPGFSKVVIEDYRLGVNQSATLDITMKVAAVGQEVRVNAEAPAIATNKAELAGAISQVQVQQLPVLGRSWLAFAVLAPGVKSDGSEGAQDAPPKAGIGVGRQDKVFLDGADLNNRSTAVNVDIRISKEVINEFQVKTTQFDAQFGQSGTSITLAVSKSGTDAYHGNGYFYFRDQKLNAADFFTRTVLPFRNEQYGGTFGGPIIKQKTQFFLNLERQHQPQTARANTGFAGFDVPLDSTDTRKMAFGRLDHALTDNHRVSFRYNRYTRSQPNANIGGSIAPSDFLDFDWTANRYNVALDSVFGAKWVNELTVSYLNNLRIFGANQNSGPRYQFPSVSIGTLDGGGIEHPTYTAIRNDASVFFNKGGRHNFKFGEYFESARVTGAFVINSSGVFAFNQDAPNLATCCPGRDQSTWDKSKFPIPTRFTQAVGDPSIDSPNKVLGLYAQDDWQPIPRLTLNLGVRYDVEFGSLANNLGPTALLEKSFDNYTKAIQPRLGFAYALDKDKKTVIRGGVGKYYSQAFLNLTFIVRQTNLPKQLTVSVNNTNNDPNFSNNPLGGKTFADFQKLIGTPALPPLAATIFAPGTTQPSEYNMALGVARQVTPTFSVQADFVYQVSKSQLRAIDSNLFCCTAKGLPRPVVSGNFPEQGGQVVGAGRPNPAFGPVTTFVNSGHATYKGLQMAADKRFANKYQFGMTYLLSRNRDNYSDPFDQAANPFNQKDEWGDSLNDQRHRFTANWVWMLPKGFTFSGIFYAASGSALANTTGSRDIFGIQPASRGPKQRPTCGLETLYNAACALLGIPNGVRIPRDAFRSAPVYRLDLGLGRPISFGKREMRLEPTIDMFNVFNHKNFDVLSYQTTLSSPKFGLPGPSTSLVYQPFQAQLGIKFSF